MQAGIFDSCKEYEIGIDWLTATKHRTGADVVFNSLGRRLIAGRARTGEKVTDYRWNGYRGSKAEGIAWGRRGDGSIIRLSGHSASWFWREVAEVADNITRIDCQTTYQVGPNSTEKVTECYEASLECGLKRGRPFLEKYWGNRFGMTGFQLGSRMSDQYCRMYDKGIESKLEHYQGCVRAETVLQGKRALSFTRQLLHKQFVQEAIDACSKRLFGNRGIVLRSAQVAPRSAIENEHAVECSGSPLKSGMRLKSFVQQLCNRRQFDEAEQLVSELHAIIIRAKMNSGFQVSSNGGTETWLC